MTISPGRICHRFFIRAGDDSLTGFRVLGSSSLLQSFIHSLFQEFAVPSFMHHIEKLRWDDHRFYHQSRINQTLHFISAISFLVAYVYLFINPAISALIGWLVGMVTRQSGHIFFEPRGFDKINNITYEGKEAVKVGYSMNRKAILLTVWISLPVLLWISPDLFGLFTALGGTPHHDAASFALNVGWIWFTLAAAGVLFRVVQLTIMGKPLTGIAWVSKILTDPFHNIAIYWKSPYYLFVKGELVADAKGMAEVKPECIEEDELAQPQQA
jgi:hypothetical protein